MTKRGVKLRSTLEREKLYRTAMALRAEGLSYNAIIATLRKDHGVSLSKSNISGWVNGKHPSRSDPCGPSMRSLVQNSPMSLACQWAMLL